MKTSNKILTGAYLVIFLITIITMAFVRSGTHTIEPLKSIGEKRTQKIPLENLRALDIAVGKVILIQKEGIAQLEIRCAENVRQHLVQRFEKDELYLGMKPSEIEDLDIEIKIYAKDIESITISENAFLVSNTFKTNEINLTTKGSGFIHMFIEADLINTFTFDRSKIYLRGTAQNLNAVVNNAG